MATLETVLVGADGTGGLIEAIVQKVYGITPHLYPEFTFDAARGDAEGEEAIPSKTRAFAVTVDALDVNAVGSTSWWRDSALITLSIRYPLGPRWQVAALGDSKQIRDELIQTPIVTTGLSIGYVTEPPDFAAADDHMMMNITIRAIVETTRS